MGPELSSAQLITDERHPTLVAEEPGDPTLVTEEPGDSEDTWGTDPPDSDEGGAHSDRDQVWLDQPPSPTDMDPDFLSRHVNLRPQEHKYKTTPSQRKQKRELKTERPYSFSHLENRPRAEALSVSLTPDQCEGASVGGSIRPRLNDFIVIRSHGPSSLGDPSNTPTIYGGSREVFHAFPSSPKEPRRRLSTEKGMCPYCKSEDVVFEDDICGVCSHHR